jgi:hypothetical protein
MRRSSLRIDHVPGIRGGLDRPLNDLDLALVRGKCLRPVFRLHFPFYSLNGLL